MKTTLSSLLVFTLLIPSIALAGDPDENYGAYTETMVEDTDAALKERCRIKEGLGEGELKVGSDIYKIRRCVNEIKKEQSNVDIRNRRKDRFQRRMERSKLQVESLRRRTARFHRRSLEVSSYRKRSQSGNRGSIATRQELLRLRSRRRSNIQGKEEGISSSRRQHALHMRQARRQCATRPHAQRAQCVSDYILEHSK